MIADQNIDGEGGKDKQRGGRRGTISKGRRMATMEGTALTRMVHSNYVTIKKHIIC